MKIENVKLFFFDKIRQLKLAIAILEIPFRDGWKTEDAYYPEKEFFIYIYIKKRIILSFFFFVVVGYERKSSRHLIKISQEIFRI